MRTKASKEIMLALVLASILAIALDVTSALARSSDSMAVVRGSVPTIDGSIEDGEWDDASTITISVTGGVNCTVYAKHDGINLYVGFHVPDVIYNSSDYCVIIFDVNHDENTLLQTDDMWLRVSRNGTQKEYNVRVVPHPPGWYPTTVSGWIAKASSTASEWQSEYTITYSKLDIAAAINKAFGLVFLIVDKDIEGYYKWPSDASITSPVTWGDMTVDSTPPTVSIISPENETYSVTDVPLTFTLSESTSWIGYSLDGQRNVTINRNTTLVSLSEGAHTITIYASDTTGNMGASDTVYLIVDTMPPNVEILSPVNKTYTTSSVSLTFTANEVTSWIGYSVDDQVNVTITGDITLSELFDGSHSIIVYATDTAGNTGVSATIFFSISTQQAEPFPTQIVAIMLIIAGVGATLLVYFTRVKKSTIKVKISSMCFIAI